jgi:hypothetical protein
MTNVTYSSHPDLYFALRGGGNNFGIVTRFNLDTYPLTPLWGGQAMYLLSDVPSRLKSLNVARRSIPSSIASIPGFLLEALGRWMNTIACKLGHCTSIRLASEIMEKLHQDSKDDPYVQLLNYLVLLPKINVYLLGGIMANGRPEAHPPALKSYRALTKPVYNTLKVKSILEWSAESGGEWNPPGFR